MSDIVMNRAYTPAEAERGKFAVVNPDLLTSMGLASSYGRYAVLTYNVGNSTSTPGASSTNPVYVVQTGTNTVSVCTLSFSNSLSTISFDPPAVFLEIYNNDSSNKLYISYETLSTVTSLTARGLPVNAQGYYSIEKTVNNLVIGSNISVSDARVFGHNIQ
jgi:uncharacterized Zn-finger protein